MSWDGERVDLLKRLWGQGLSASQIAAQLGHGISRNAVIGKVHRMGLAGRAKPAGAAAAAGRSAKKAPQQVMVQKTVQVRGNTAMLREVVAEAVSEPLARAGALIIPLSERVTIMELRERMCRWPLGDPLSSEFRYCGCRSEASGSYCHQHGRLAYQQPTDRRR